MHFSSFCPLVLVIAASHLVVGEPTYFQHQRFEHIRPGPGWHGWDYQGVKEHRGHVTFYENRFCQGGSYSFPHSHDGECQTIPESLWHWNLSLKSVGQCSTVEVFDNASCSRKKPHGGASSHKKGLVTWSWLKANQCTSTKLNGFDIVKSFRRFNRC